MTREQRSLLQRPGSQHGLPSIAPGQSRKACDGEAIVFVVEDDGSLRGAILNLLRSVGLQAREFSSATELLGMR